MVVFEEKTIGFYIVNVKQAGSGALAGIALLSCSRRRFYRIALRAGGVI